MLTPLLFHFQPLSASVRQKLYFPWIWPHLMLTPLLFHFQPLSVSVRQKLYFPWIFQMSFSSYVTVMCAYGVLSFRHSSHCPFQWGWGSNLPVDGQQGCWGKQTLLSAAWPGESTHKHTHTHTCTYTCITHLIFRWFTQRWKEWRVGTWYIYSLFTLQS